MAWLILFLLSLLSCNTNLSLASLLSFLMRIENVNVLPKYPARTLAQTETRPLLLLLVCWRQVEEYCYYVTGNSPSLGRLIVLTYLKRVFASLLFFSIRDCGVCQKVFTRLMREDKWVAHFDQSGRKRAHFLSLSFGSRFYSFKIVIFQRDGRRFRPSTGWCHNRVNMSLKHKTGGLRSRGDDRKESTNKRKEVKKEKIFFRCFKNWKKKGQNVFEKMPRRQVETTLMYLFCL